MILNQLEKLLIKKFLFERAIVIENEKFFFSSLSVKSRDFSGVGFLTDLHQSESLKIGDNSESSREGGIGAKLNSSVDTDYLFYIDNGYLNAIEGSTYTDDWPDDIFEIEIYEY